MMGEDQWSRGGRAVLRMNDEGGRAEGRVCQVQDVERHGQRHLFCFLSQEIQGPGSIDWETIVL
jgi:hypothetical protein